jgi:hypothetical protein
MTKAKNGVVFGDVIRDVAALVGTDRRVGENTVRRESAGVLVDLVGGQAEQNEAIETGTVFLDALTTVEGEGHDGLFPGHEVAEDERRQFAVGVRPHEVIANLGASLVMLLSVGICTGSEPKNRPGTQT